MHPVTPHGAGNLIGRATWGIVQALLFRPSPRILHRWRNLLLRLFGARLHPTARVYPRARIWAPWNLDMAEFSCIADDVDVYTADRITIGAHSTVSQYGYLCAASHDFEDVAHPLTTAPIVIGRRCWLAADVFVGPGVTIGDGTVVGARSGVFDDLPGWSVAIGTPAKAVRQRGLAAADFGDVDSTSNSREATPRAGVREPLARG
jgi:putative colanic acid biosynthesis acetyltransferase WcaF